MITRSASAVALLLAAGATGGCAILYDFTEDGGTGGAGTTGPGASSGANATTTRSSSTTAISAVATEATAVEASSSTGGPTWKCTTDADCFGGLCGAEGCGIITRPVPGLARGLHLSASDESASVIYDDEGIRVGVVRATGMQVASAVVGTSASATSFVAHDADEIVIPLPGLKTVHRYYQSGWGAASNTMQATPDGVDNLPLNGILSTEHGWVAVAGTNLVTMVPASTAGENWMFALHPVSGLNGTPAQGHSLVHHAGARYVFSMYDDLGGTGCLGIAEYAAGDWVRDCQLVGARRAAGIASDGEHVAFRTSNADSSQDVVSWWRPGMPEVHEIARMPYRGRQSVAIDSEWIYFDGVADSDSQGFFRCRKDADPDVSPLVNSSCETLGVIPSPGAQYPAIGGVASVRLDATTPDERSLICWIVGAELSCRVTP